MAGCVLMLLISLLLMALSGVAAVGTSSGSNGGSGSNVAGVAESSKVEDGRLLISYMNCNQPGPTPGCRYHPYWNTVTPTNTTMNPYQQLQISDGQAHGIASASAFDAERQLMYFFSGDEQTVYTIVAGPMPMVLPPVTLNVTELGGAFLGVNWAHWCNITNNLLAIVAVDNPDTNRLVQIDPHSGTIAPLDSAVDPSKRLDYTAGGGLGATDGRIIVSPRGSGGSEPPHSLAVANVSSGEAQIVVTQNMHIYGLVFGDGEFWAIGTRCPACPKCVQCDKPESMLAKIDPHTGAVMPHPHANMTKYDGFGMQIGRSTFDHARGVLYFTCDPDIVGVSVRTGEVVVSSPLVHWADGTQDAGFVLAMQFQRQ